ncbi:MAG: hypothetical protein U0229_16400 [Anaeromyxobacter sp.]
MRPPGRAAAAAALLLAACSSELPVPPGIKLTCDASACPAGFTCVTTVSPAVCIPSDQLSATPDVGAKALAPSTAREGVDVRLEFTATKALGKDPVVRLGLTPPRLFVKDAAASTGNAYVYRYAPQGDEPQGQDFPVTADLQDVQGLVSTGRALGQVRFDFAAPAALAPALTGSPARFPGTIRVTFTASEDLSTDPAVKIGGVPMAKDPAGTSGRAYAFTYAATGTEAEDPAGLPITAELVDGGGNVAALTLPPRAVFDRTKPALAAAPAVTPAAPAAAAEGTLVRVSFTATEDLGVDPVVRLGAIVLDKGAQSGRTYTYGHLATQADGEGAKGLSFELADLAGNAQTVAGPAVALDFGAPTITALTLCAQDGTNAPCAAPGATFSARAGHDAAKLTFTLSEPADVVVTVGTDLLPAGACTGAGLQRACTFSVTDPAAGAQPRVETAGVYVQATDPAGNRALVNTFLTKDFQPPRLAGQALLERCDAYGPARLAQDDLWTKARDAYGCTFTGASTSGPVRVTFAVDEPLSGPPAVGVDGGAGAFVTDTALAPPQYAALLSVTPAAGARQVLAQVTDAVGNPATLALGTLRVDTTAPPAPDTLSIGKITYARYPWGVDGTSGAKAYYVSGGPAAAAAGNAIVVYDGDGATGAQIGRTTADAAGGFGASAPFAVSSGNLPEVFVAQEDLAGNSSPRALVWEGEWTATTGFKQFGSVDANPHVLTADAVWGPSRFSPTQVEVANEASLGRRNFGAAATAGAPSMVEATPGPLSPSARASCAMAHDLDTGRTVLFGGYTPTPANNGGTQNVPLSDTWEWDGRRWRQLFPPAHPVADASPKMAHDPVRGRTVLVTGSAETWELDGENWKKVCWSGCPATQCSCTLLPNFTTGLFWDATRAAVVVANGTQSWDGTDWKPIPQAQPLTGVTASLLATRDDGGAPLAVADAGTYTWNGNAWTLAGGFPFVAGVDPTSKMAEWALWWDVKSRTYLAYDVRNNLLRGWTGSAWLARTAPATPTASLVQQACGASDLEHGGLVRFGGCTGIGPDPCTTFQPAIAETSRLEDGFALAFAPGVSPPARSGHAMTDVRDQGRAWLFDGLGTSTNYPLQDEWTWDGVRWTQIPTTANISSSGLMRGTLAWLGAGRLVQVGGVIQGTGASYPTPGSITTQTRLTSDPSWSIVSTNDPFGYAEPTGNGADDQAMVWDTTHQEAVYFRGTENGVATWTGKWAASDPAWNGPGVLWTPHPLATLPPTSSGHRLAHCPVAGGTVLFGGDTGDTWIWDGASWSWMTTPRSPAQRRDHVMWCDEKRGRVLVFGGSLLDDVWEFDGVTWYQLFPFARPTPRTLAAGAYVSARGEGVLFGGNAGTQASASGDTWVVDGAADRRPAHVFHANFGAAGTGPAKFWGATVIWDATAGLSRVGANGSTQAARLWVRNGDRWEPLTPTAPGPSLLWSSDDDPAWNQYDLATRSVRVRRLFGGDRRVLSLAVSPEGTNGNIAGYTSITTRYLEAKVRYRLDCLGVGASTTTAQRCCSGAASGALALTCQ